MTDPNELPEWTEEERLLLASADLDRPPADSLTRTLRAAGAASAVATGVVATHGAAATLAGKVGGSFAFVKWLVLASCVGAGALGVSVWHKRRVALSTLAPSAAAVRPAALAVAPAAPAALEPSAEPPAADTAPAASAEPVAPARSTGPRAAASVTTQPDLSRDIAALDQARQALRAGRAGDALSALDQYDAEFGKSSALRVEASVLRIEATARAGNRSRAQTLARNFLAHNPKSPYTARVQAILER